MRIRSIRTIEYYNQRKRAHIELKKKEYLLFWYPLRNGNVKFKVKMKPQYN